jgi:hypothetical protein
VDEAGSGAGEEVFSDNSVYSDESGFRVDNTKQADTTRKPVKFIAKTTTYLRMRSI